MNARAALGRVELALRAVGLGVWFFIGLERHVLVGVGLGFVAWLVYGAAYVASAIPRVPAAAAVAMLATQSIGALAMPLLGFRGFEGLMLGIVAAEAMTVLALGPCIAYALAQYIAMILVVSHTENLRTVIEIAGAHGTFVAFVFLVMQLLAREARAKRELADAHSALRAAQARLAESERAGERLRIARELHDSLGHQLAAMSLQLELATQPAAGEGARDAVTRSREISREMFDELRRVVGALREDAPVDLGAALATIARSFPSPQIELAVPERPVCVAPSRAHVVFRCAQEAITNVLKHASAAHVWMVLGVDDEGVTLRVRDDGEGTDAFVAGAGLRGMRERAEAIGGRLATESSRGRGFEVSLWVPQTGTNA